ncbi:MAG TPA: hypothetical protein VM677_34830 [Actinokineospora sp.]|jgi:hypothetical protein|nr:hypothetical protein [Actinokineospora sp.]
MPTRPDLIRGLLAYKQHGWDAFTDEHGNIMIGVGEHFDAITFPQSLATTITDALPNAPLFLDASTHRCTLLTKQAPRALALPAALREARVRALPRHTPLLLPLPAGLDVDRHWLTDPTPHHLPSWARAIAAMFRTTLRWSRA